MEPASHTLTLVRKVRISCFSSQVSSAEDLEKLEAFDFTLQERHLLPHFPRKHLAERTVFLSRTSRWVVDRIRGQIMDNTEDENPSLGLFDLVICNAEDEHL